MLPYGFEKLKKLKKEEKLNKIKECFKDLSKYEDEMQYKLAVSGKESETFDYLISKESKRMLRQMPTEWIVDIANTQLKYIRIRKPEEMCLGESIYFDEGEKVLRLIYTNTDWDTSLEKTQDNLLKNLFVFLVSTSLLISIFVPPLYDFLDKYSMLFSLSLFLLCCYVSIKSGIKIIIKTINTVIKGN